jgi:hypothetical protein
MLAKLKSEPAVVIGVVAAALLAALQSLAGHGVISQNVIDTVAGALDPTKGGWAIPILVGLVTRFFVSPAAK